jgi:hypothetical protein
MISFGENNFTPGRENWKLNFRTPKLVHHYISYSLQFMLICPWIPNHGWASRSKNDWVWKGPSPFESTGPSLKTRCNLIAHLYWKFDFFHGYIHYQAIILCIAYQIWTSFKIPTKYLKKNQDFVCREKKRLKECLDKFFWPKILTTNTLGTKVYKMYECDKNQMLYVL